MSQMKREALVKQLVASNSTSRGCLKDSASDISAGSWDLVSFSYQRGFEEFWDLAAGDASGLLTRPLLSLFRQSVELALKSAILEVNGTFEGKSAHKLQDLFEQLQRKCKAAGLCLDDDFTQEIEEMIKEIQSYDPFADRFRYPSNVKGTPHKGIDVDLDRVFQAHWSIVTWCEGVVVELRENFGIGRM